MKNKTHAIPEAWAAGQGLPDDAQRTTIEARLKITAGDWGTP